MAWALTLCLLLCAVLQFVCIVDDSKMVSGLGGSKLAMPVEIVQVWWIGQLLLLGHCLFAVGSL